MTLRQKCFAVLVVLSLSAVAFAQSGDQAVFAPAASAKFATLPVLPSCAMFAADRGDPTKGSAILLAKATSGCVIPWHWHTYAEQLGFVSGTAKVEMKDGQPSTMKKGDYIYLPGNHQHQFTCVESCMFFIGIDGAFDIHYVDKSGKEIPLDQAIKSAPAKKAPVKK
jgi:quercetin dioxygenase-like cupin family protein